MNITLCGSSRNGDGYHKWNRELTLLSHCIYSPSIEGEDCHREDQKEVLDLVHLKKISNSDAILIVGIVDDLAAREILWAQMEGKVRLYADSLSAMDRLYLGYTNPTE